jgi:hypothetical protein
MTALPALAELSSSLPPSKVCCGNWSTMGVFLIAAVDVVEVLILILGP